VIVAQQIQVAGLFISPGHNYFGHHDRPAGEHPIVSVPEVECLAGKGLVGDRFLDFKDNYKGQITFFAMEVFNQLQRELNLPGARPEGTRRNVFTRGVDLNTLVGMEFEVQGVLFCGTAECTPCYWMNSALGPGAEKFLQGRGGLRARILTDGVLRVDA
jgi:MOSC domain-containing protein YiiM